MKVVVWASVVPSVIATISLPHRRLGPVLLLSCSSRHCRDFDNAVSMPTAAASKLGGKLLEAGLRPHLADEIGVVQSLDSTTLAPSQKELPFEKIAEPLSKRYLVFVTSNHSGTGDPFLMSDMIGQGTSTRISGPRFAAADAGVKIIQKTRHVPGGVEFGYELISVEGPQEIAFKADHADLSSSIRRELERAHGLFAFVAWPPASRHASAHRAFSKGKLLTKMAAVPEKSGDRCLGVLVVPCEHGFDFACEIRSELRYVTGCRGLHRRIRNFGRMHSHRSGGRTTEGRAPPPSVQWQRPDH